MQNEQNINNAETQAVDYTACYVQPSFSLYNEDCRDTLKRLKTGSVDLLLQDPPYGVTMNDWDIKPDLSEMWNEWNRVTKINGAIIFTATQPFASLLILSNIKNFRYDLIWEKSIGTGFLNANKMPIRGHEIILMFYRKLPVYNPQKYYLSTPSFKKGNQARHSPNYSKYLIPMEIGTKDGSRFPRSVFSIKTEAAFFDATGKSKMIHPTQKPVNLMRYLISTFSNEGDLVFDGYSGSGTTGEACILEKRQFIGAELKREYFDKSVERIKALHPRLF